MSDPEEPVIGLSAHWRDAVSFKFPIGWADLKPEDRHAYARDIARRILAVAPSGAMPPKS